MTTRTQTKMVPQVETVYIAEDGTEFLRSSSCRAYENTLKQKRAMEAIAGIETCNELKNYANFDGTLSYMEDGNIFWYRPKNEDEIEKLNDAFCDSSYKDFKSSMIGKWLCMEVDSDDGLYALTTLTTLDDAIAYASDVLSKLGYDLTVTKRGDVGDSE